MTWYEERNCLVIEPSCVIGVRLGKSLHQRLFTRRVGLLGWFAPHLKLYGADLGGECKVEFIVVFEYDCGNGLNF